MKFLEDNLEEVILAVIAVWGLIWFILIAKDMDGFLIHALFTLLVATLMGILIRRGDKHE